MKQKEYMEKLDPGRKLINDVFTTVEPAYGFGVFLVDMEKAHDLIQQIKEGQGVRLTYLHLFIRACGLALARYPKVNALLSGTRKILHPDTVEIGVSVAGTTNFAPVVIIREPDKKDLPALAEELRLGTEQARAEEAEMHKKITAIGRFLPFSWLRKLCIRLFFGIAKIRRNVVGTFQISCLPEEILVPFRLNTTALMGLGQVRERPAVIDGKVVPRRSVYFSLPIDHRVVDGKEPMLFAYEVIRLMESPDLLM